MIDVSGIEYDFLPSVLWVLGVIVVGVGLLVWSYKREGEDWSEALFVAGVLAVIFSLTIGPLTAIFYQADTSVTKQERAIVKEQLSDQGFSRVDLNWEGKTFTASVDGEYFEGLLHPVGDYKYQVLEVGEVKP